MLGTIVTVRATASDVPILRGIALEDHAGFANSLADHEGDELHAHRKMMQEPARILDALESEATAGATCEIRVDAEYLRGLLGSVGQQALGVLETDSADPSERRDALQRLHCCVRVLEALEEA